MNDYQTDVESSVVPRTFGDNLRAAIAKAGISQSELADRVGTGKGQVSTWTKADNVELETLLKIATALDVSVESLCEGINPEYDARRLAAPLPERFAELWPRVSPRAREAWLRMLLVIADAPPDDDEPPKSPTSPS